METNYLFNIFVIFEKNLSLQIVISLQNSNNKCGFDILWCGVEHRASESILSNLYLPSPNSRCFLLQQLVVLLVQANSVFPPELLRLVHWTPLQASRLQLRAVLIKRTAGGRMENTINMWGKRNTFKTHWESMRALPKILNALSQSFQEELDVISDVLIIIFLLFQVLQLFEHFALDHGKSVFLTGLSLSWLLQQVL